MSVFYVQDTKYEHCGQSAKWIFIIKVPLEVCTLLKDAMGLTLIKGAMGTRWIKRLRCDWKSCDSMGIWWINLKRLESFIMFQRVVEYHPVVAWVLFQDGKKFGKTHPMWLKYMIRRIKRYIICPDWCTLQGGVR